MAQQKKGIPMTKDEIHARHNGSPPATVAVMDGEAMVTDAVSATAPEAPRLAVQIIPAPDMAEYELKPAHVDQLQQVDPLTALQNAVHDLDLARHRARECKATTATLRDTFAKALAAWNVSVPAPMTQAALMQDYIDSNQRERQRKAEARQLQRPATVSETARAMSGGNRRPGGGASYKRGAFSRAEARTIEMNRMAAARMNGNIAPRAKLPSER